MGRQACLTRLALGRSPYEAPVLSESGDFVLGQRAHELDNSDCHTQQFNDRGHPEFRNSRVAARELRNAKNDIFSTVGRAHKLSKLPREKDGAKPMEIVDLDAEVFIFAHRMTLLTVMSSVLWLHALRLRVETFQNYSRPLSHIVKSELRTFGTLSFFATGVPEILFRMLLQFWLNERAAARVSVDSSAPVVDKTLKLLSWLVNLSVNTIGNLKYLHLVPGGALIPLSSPLPLTSGAVLDRGVRSVRTLIAPLLLVWAHGRVSQFALSRFLAIVERILAADEDGDEVSKKNDLGGPLFWLRKLKDWMLGRACLKSQNRPPSLLSHEEFSARIVTEETHRGQVERASTATPDAADLFDVSDLPRAGSDEAAELSPVNTFPTGQVQSSTASSPASPYASPDHQRGGVYSSSRDRPEMGVDVGEQPTLTSGDIVDASMTNRVSGIHEGQRLETAGTSRSGDDREGHVAGETESQQSQTVDGDAHNFTAHDHRGRHFVATGAHDMDSSENRSRHTSARARRPPSRFESTGPVGRTAMSTDWATEALKLPLALLLTDAARLPLDALLARSLTSLFVSDSSPSHPPSLAGPRLDHLRPLPCSHLVGLRRSATSSLSPTGSSVSGLGLLDWRHYANVMILFGAQALLGATVWILSTTVATALGRRWLWRGRLTEPDRLPGRGRGELDQGDRRTGHERAGR